MAATGLKQPLANQVIANANQMKYGANKSLLLHALAMGGAI